MDNAASRDVRRQPLNEDVLRAILAKIPRTDLISASLVNRDFASIARDFILRRFVLDLGDIDKCKLRLGTLRSKPNIAGFVKELSIIGELQTKPWWQYVENFEDEQEVPRVEALEELQKLIQDGILTAGLREVTWDAGLGMPVALIEAIQAAHPECTFVLDKYAGSPLPPMPNLVSITATVHVYGEPILCFRPIILHSPRLRHLRIASYQDAGCVVRGFSLDHVFPRPFLTCDWTGPLCGRDGPFIEELSLKQMSWTTDGAARSVRDMSWSRLRKLQLDRCDAIPLLRASVPACSMFPSLAEFTYTMWYDDEGTRASVTQALQEFLSTASGLQSLRLEGPYPPVVTTIIAHHGDTLRSLILHDHERPNEPQRTTMKTSDLLALGERCSSLQHLGFDVDPGYRLAQEVGDSEVEPLANIFNSDGRFSALRMLTLYTMLGITQYQDRDTARDLDALKQHVSPIMVPAIGNAGAVERGTGKLQSIVINIGEQDREMGFGYPAGRVFP
ncbi:uncharacterized protein C8Q71DRAFT_856154 [Rhodofomes roseus]|uniref:F-box domain-containing protein n=1 Tax=Rhodofomes roseus TaxID=34475 RepID=A0ABQ8KMK1_9APHY|nr:uncharacterized protein C8Q71DRAFT_856154 [Rhodofomes roseus]KAH9839552.1 hypothetical protein C8Q71DRAFT_856154 [Rhodofomes roseus]